MAKEREAEGQAAEGGNVSKLQRFKEWWKGLFSDNQTQLTIGIVFAFLFLFLAISYFSYLFTGKYDQSIIEAGGEVLAPDMESGLRNNGGMLGATVADMLINQWFGLSSLCLIILVGMISVRLLLKTSFSMVYWGWIMIFLTLWGALFFGFIMKYANPQMSLYIGGEVGFACVSALAGQIGGIATLLLLLIVLFLFCSYTFDGFNPAMLALVGKIKEKISKKKEEGENEAQADGEDENNDGNDGANADENEANGGEEEKGAGAEGEGNDDEKDEKNDDGIHTETNGENDGGEEKADAESKQETAANKQGGEPEFTFEVRTGDDDAQEGDSQETKEEPKQADLEIENNTMEYEEAEKILEPYDPTKDLEFYKGPTLDLLKQYPQTNVEADIEELNENKERIIQVLNSFKVEITKISASVGPTVTLYEVTPADGVRINKIQGLGKDIALHLKALGVRVIAPMPGKGTVGIEVPNKNPKMVPMYDMIASKKFQESKMELPMVLGKTITNDIYMVDLAKCPHVICAGATGQGKSVGLNACLTSLLYKKHPAELKLVLIDPKMVEFAMYAPIVNHFLAMMPNEQKAIITDMDKVVPVLGSLCVEMDARYELLMDAHVRNIKEYNQKFIERKLNPEKGHRYMPYIVLIIDEFADLIMTAGKGVEEPIARIAQKARAIGIHTILATQRPDAKVITGLIRANFPVKFAFKVTSSVNSSVILDQPGAEELIGRGDMLVSYNSELTRVQCAFVDTPEVEQINKYISEQQAYPMPYILPDYTPDGESVDEKDVDLQYRDPMFEDAARLIVETQQGSTSSIQRKMSLGYNRSGRIMDQLEVAGIVGPQKAAGKPREVMILDLVELEAKLEEIKKKYG